jgi:hypothetical protein
MEQPSTADVQPSRDAHVGLLAVRITINEDFDL